MPSFLRARMMQAGACIINISSRTAIGPQKKNAPYAASKAALSSATAHLAVELGGYNIRVNSAYMGWMWGPPVEFYMEMMKDTHPDGAAGVKAE